MENVEEELEGLVSSSTMNAEESLFCRACGRAIPKNKPTSSSSLEMFTPNTNGLRFSTSENNTILCLACKKFYCRYRNRIRGEKCSCTAGAKCRICRYRQCETAILEKNSRGKLQCMEGQPFLDKVDFTKLPCAVCGCSSTGYHFGAISCEGCKGFFRRSMMRNPKHNYACKAVRDGTVAKTLCAPGSNCRKCRLARCLAAGMSLNEIEIGRHTMRRRIEIDAAIRKHCSEGSFLKGKVSRKRVRLSPSSPSFGSQTTDSFSVPSCSAVNNKLEPAVNSKSFQNENGETQKNGPPDTTSPQMNQESQSNAMAVSYTEDYSNVMNSSNKNAPEWLIERSVEAAARLSTISMFRLCLTYEMTLEEKRAKRMQLFESYVKCVAEYITCLPGISEISLPDRIILFTQSFFPITVAQLSLNFDVEKQIPNHFSTDREGPTWEICAKERPECYLTVENYLREAGNQFVSVIFNLKEFSFCCALLFLNPDTPSLENVESVRLLRRRYDLAFSQYFSSHPGSRTEEHLARFYQLLTFLRRSTPLIQDIFNNAVSKLPPQVPVHWSPLFKQCFSQIMRLPNLANSKTVPTDLFKTN